MPLQRDGHCSFITHIRGKLDGERKRERAHTEWELKIYIFYANKQQLLQQRHIQRLTTDVTMNFLSSIQYAHSPIVFHFHSAFQTLVNVGCSQFQCTTCDSIRFCIPSSRQCAIVVVAFACKPNAILSDREQWSVDVFTKIRKIKEEEIWDRLKQTRAKQKLRKQDFVLSGFYANNKKNERETRFICCCHRCIRFTPHFPHNLRYYCNRIITYIAHV